MLGLNKSYNKQVQPWQEQFYILLIIYLSISGEDHGYQRRPHNLKSSRCSPTTMIQ